VTRYHIADTMSSVCEVDNGHRYKKVCNKLQFRESCSIISASLFATFKCFYDESSRARFTYSAL
jgi:hypothetical protein